MDKLCGCGEGVDIEVPVKIRNYIVIRFESNIKYEPSTTKSRLKS
jgi:hypothetical protein